MALQSESIIEHSYTISYDPILCDEAITEIDKVIDLYENVENLVKQVQGYRIPEKFPEKAALENILSAIIVNGEKYEMLKKDLVNKKIVSDEVMEDEKEALEEFEDGATSLNPNEGDINNTSKGVIIRYNGPTKEYYYKVGTTEKPTGVPADRYVPCDEVPSLKEQNSGAYVKGADGNWYMKKTALASDAGKVAASSAVITGVIYYGSERVYSYKDIDGKIKPTGVPADTYVPYNGILPTEINKDYVKGADGNWYIKKSAIDTSTGNTSGGSASGGSTSGGNTSGGSTSGGSTSGGNTSGESTSGGNTSGGSTSGGNTSGGSPEEDKKNEDKKTDNSTEPKKEENKDSNKTETIKEVYTNSNVLNKSNNVDLDNKEVEEIIEEENVELKVSDDALINVPWSKDPSEMDKIESPVVPPVVTEVIEEAKPEVAPIENVETLISENPKIEVPQANTSNKSGIGVAAAIGGVGVLAGAGYGISKKMQEKKNDTSEDDQYYEKTYYTDSRNNNTKEDIDKYEDLYNN